MDGYELSRWFVPDEFLSPNGTERNISIGESEEKRIEIGEMKYYFKNIKSQELISAYYETQAMNWIDSSDDCEYCLSSDAVFSLSLVAVLTVLILGIVLIGSIIYNKYKGLSSAKKMS